MKSRVDVDDQEAIEAEAMAWVVQLDGGSPSRADMAALREWAGRSPEHYAKLREMAQLWGEIDGLEVLKSAVRPATPVSESAPAPARARGFRRFAPVALAAALLLSICVGGATWAALGGGVFVPTAEASYSTAVGELREITLPDGSTIFLNTNTSLRVAYTRRERRISLRRGEALFDVAKDAQRPFTVVAGGTAVRAVGTAFSVRVKHSHVGILVAEGTVELYPTLAALEAGDESATLATANQVGTLSRAEAEVHTLVDGHLDRLMAWREGALVYDGEPLEYVLGELSRYTGTRYEFAEPELRGLSIGGRFGVGETEALMEALEEGFSLEVTRLGDRRVMISRAGPD